MMKGGLSMRSCHYMMFHSMITFEYVETSCCLTLLLFLKLALIHNLRLFCFSKCQVHFKYEIEKSSLAHNACKCAVYIGITWLKSTKFQQRITLNITEKFAHRLKEIIGLVEREILLATQQDTSSI